jgi:hypothetical protein
VWYKADICVSGFHEPEYSLLKKQSIVEPLEGADGGIRSCNSELEYGPYVLIYIKLTTASRRISSSNFRRF